MYLEWGSCGVGVNLLVEQLVAVAQVAQNRLL
jgi:hypothetical protein